MNDNLREIEWDGDIGDPVYLRFSDEQVARTESHRSGNVAVDFDRQDRVIGIEMLDADAGDWEVLGQIAVRYKLRFDLFFVNAKNERKATSKASR